MSGHLYAPTSLFIPCPLDCLSPSTLITQSAFLKTVSWGTRVLSHFLHLTDSVVSFLSYILYSSVSVTSTLLSLSHKSSSWPGTAPSTHFCSLPPQCKITSSWYKLQDWSIITKVLSGLRASSGGREGGREVRYWSQQESPRPACLGKCKLWLSAILTLELGCRGRNPFPCSSSFTIRTSYLPLALN